MIGAAVLGIRSWLDEHSRHDLRREIRMSHCKVVRSRWDAVKLEEAATIRGRHETDPVRIVEQLPSRHDSSDGTLNRTTLFINDPAGDAD